MVAVLGIWSTVAYKFFAALNPESPTVQTLEMVSDFNPKDVKQPDTFSIQKVNRDPFLGTISALNKPVKKRGKANPINTKSLPQITYRGSIKKKNTKQQIFVVNIDNQQYLFEKGETQQEVKLMSGDDSKITVKVQGHRLTVKKQ